MTPHDDDLLCAEAARGYHSTQTDCSVSDDGHTLAGADSGRDGRVMACAHHVRKREERWHQRVVTFYRQDVERSVRQGDAHRFGLRSRDLLVAEEAPVDARRMKPFMAEGAGAVGPGERHHDHVAAF